MDGKLLYIGQIFEVTDTTYTSKKDGVIHSSIEVQIEQVFRDEKNKRHKAIEKLKFNHDLLEMFEQNLDKYIVIPYEAKFFNGQMRLDPITDDNFFVSQYEIYDKDPTPPKKPKPTPKPTEK